MGASETSSDLRPFQFALLILSVVVLVGIAAEWILPLPHEVERLIFLVDTAVCGLLFTDLVVRFQQAESKLKFWRTGWIDLLACIPAVEALRWGRLFRIFRVLRVVVGIRSLSRFLQILSESRREAGVASLLVIWFLVVSFGSAGVLVAEEGVEGANIHTAEDALWWAMATVTTVGYGDRFPVSDIGRLIASVVMVCGIGLFGTLSGVAASFFLGERNDEPASGARQLEMLERLEALERRLAERSTPGAPPS